MASTTRTYRGLPLDQLSNYVHRVCPRGEPENTKGWRSWYTDGPVRATAQEAFDDYADMVALDPDATDRTHGFTVRPTERRAIIAALAAEVAR